MVKCTHACSRLLLAALSCIPTFLYFYCFSVAYFYITEFSFLNYIGQIFYLFCIILLFFLSFTLLTLVCLPSTPTPYFCCFTRGYFPSKVWALGFIYKLQSIKSWLFIFARKSEAELVWGTSWRDFKGTQVEDGIWKTSLLKSTSQIPHPLFFKCDWLCAALHFLNQQLN